MIWMVIVSLVQAAIIALGVGCFIGINRQEARRLTALREAATGQAHSNTLDH